MIIQNLKALLATYYESVTLPRKWLFVEALPRNAQGKLPAHALARFFHESRPWKPDVFQMRIDGHHALIHAIVPADLRYLDGHFEEIAVVPGVAQLHWALAFSKACFGLDPEVARMDAIKFHRLMLPEESFELDLTWNAEQRKLTFSFHSDSKKYSSGRFVLRS